MENTGVGEILVKIKVDQLAALMALLGTSQLVNGSKEMQKLALEISGALAKYYVLAELNVVPALSIETHMQICELLQMEFQEYLEGKMTLTREALRK